METLFDICGIIGSIGLVLVKMYNDYFENALTDVGNKF